MFTLFISRRLKMIRLVPRAHTAASQPVIKCILPPYRFFANGDVNCHFITFGHHTVKIYSRATAQEVFKHFGDYIVMRIISAFPLGRVFIFFIFIKRILYFYRGYCFHFSLILAYYFRISLSPFAFYFHSERGAFHDVARLLSPRRLSPASSALHNMAYRDHQRRQLMPSPSMAAITFGTEFGFDAFWLFSFDVFLASREVSSPGEPSPPTLRPQQVHLLDMIDCLIIHCYMLSAKDDNIFIKSFAAGHYLRHKCSRAGWYSRYVSRVFIIDSKYSAILLW